MGAARRLGSMVVVATVAVAATVATASTALAAAPTAAPGLVAPLYNASVTGNPVLQWSAVPGVKSYKVELDDADDFVGAQSFTTVNTALALTEPVIVGKTYFWRVQGISATTGVTSAYSDIRSFRSDWPAATGQPILLNPANDPTIEVTDVVFRWQPILGARSYQIQVSPNPEFANNITDDQVVRGSQYSPATTYNNATYYWRVRALDTAASAHPGPWSDRWLFLRAWTSGRCRSRRSATSPPPASGSAGTASGTPVSTSCRSRRT